MFDIKRMQTWQEILEAHRRIEEESQYQRFMRRAQQQQEDARILPSAQPQSEHDRLVEECMRGVQLCCRPLSNNLARCMIGNDIRKVF